MMYVCFSSRFILTGPVVVEPFNKLVPEGILKVILVLFSVAITDTKFNLFPPLTSGIKPPTLNSLPRADRPLLTNAPA